MNGNRSIVWIVLAALALFPAAAAADGIEPPPIFAAGPAGPPCPRGFWQPQNLNECLDWPRNDPASLMVVAVDSSGNDVESIQIYAKQKSTDGTTPYQVYRSGGSEAIDTVLDPQVPAGYQFVRWDACDSIVDQDYGPGNEKLSSEDGAAEECAIVVPRGVSVRVTLVVQAA